MIKVVELEGSYYQIGQGWGEALREDMPKIIQIELGTVAALLGVDIKTVVAIGSSYLEVAEKYDPDFMQVLKGFSQGAEVDFNTFFAIRAVLEILFQTSRPEGMCTSFAVTGEATASGETIIGQNIDWHPELPLVLLRINWPNGVQQLSLTLGGVFEYSLSHHPSYEPYAGAATLTATSNSRPGQPTVPVSIVMQKAYRQANIDKALAEFAASELNIASFLLADGAGNISGIELGAGTHVLLSSPKGTLVHANHYQSDLFVPKDIFLPYVPDSPLRQARLTKLIDENYGNITVDHMKRFLADHENYPKAICAHVDPKSELPPSATVGSVIMVPARKMMYVAAGTPCSNDYIPFDMNNE